MPFLTLGTLFWILHPLQFTCWNPIQSLRSIKLVSLPWKLSSLHQTWVISVTFCTTLIIWPLFESCILYSFFLKATSYSKFYSLQLYYIVSHIILCSNPFVGRIDNTTYILLTYLLQCDYSGEEGWEYKQIQAGHLVLLGPLLV